MLKTTQLLKRLWKCQKTSMRNLPYLTCFHEYLDNQPKARASCLPNGLTVVTEDRDSFKACLGLFFDAGSRYENLFENGIAHFFEHIAFKSTRNWDNASLQQCMESTGAVFKCFTTREMVAYYAECLCQDVPQIVELLSECIFNNAFRQGDIDLQKQVVFSEMLEHDRHADRLVDDYLHRTAFQGTPLSQSVLGLSSNLFNFNSNTIDNYLKRLFDPTRMVFVGVGGLTHDGIVQLANACLCKYEPTKCIDLGGTRYTGSEIRYRDDSQPQATVTIAVESPSFCHRDTLVLDVAAAVVGGWDKSQYGGEEHATRVARAASQAHLCHSYKAFNLTYKDTGLWGVKFVAPRLHLDDMVYIIQDEWMYLCTVVSPKEVERAKRQMKAKLLSKSESCVATCLALGRSYLYKKGALTLVQQLKAIDDVSDLHVKEVCMKYLYDQCPVVAAVGPSEALPDYDRIRAGMYWLRL